MPIILSALMATMITVYSMGVLVMLMFVMNVGSPFSLCFAVLWNMVATSILIPFLKDAKNDY